jgi:hypothetical protein
MLKFRVGDKAYILGKGYGQVSVILPDGSFDVMLEGYGAMHFNPDGSMGQSPLKRVYYENPVVIEPVKNQRLWRAFVHMSKVVFAELAKLDSVGGLLEPDD